MSHINVTQSKRNMQQQRRENNRSYHNDMGFMFVAQSKVCISDFAKDSLELNRDQKRELLQ